MRKKLGTFCMSLGAVLILAALSLFLANRQENNEAGYLAQDAVLQLREQAAAAAKTDDPALLPDPFDPAMTETEIDGYRYVGYVYLEPFGMALPVMSDWSYPQLKIAPCRYFGSTKTDNIVIAAHNYERHFGKIKDLSAGDRIFFTDMDGIVSEYAVAAVEILSPTAVEDMTAGSFALTLFTCTYGGKYRVTVRCDRAAE